MALFPKIVEVSRDVESGETYVLVDFYPTLRDKQSGHNRAIREEFIMQLRRMARVAIGKPSPDDPAEVIVTGYVDRPVDFRTEMLRNISEFARRAEANGWRGDMRGRERRRDSADTRGILGELAKEVEA